MGRVRVNGATSGAGVLGTYAYDDRGRRVSLTRGNGTVTSYGYDPVSRLQQLVQSFPAQPANNLTLGFGYNPAGQIVSNTRSNDAYSFTGHANQNVTDTINGLNQIDQTGTTDIDHGLAGNISAIGAANYGYTSENLMITAPGVTLDYDPLLRLSETVGGGTTTRFAYDGAEMIAEYNASNQLQRRFVHGPGVDEPLVWYEGTGTATRRWFHADERGSIVAVSDASGNLVGGVNRYDEYGAPQGTLTGRFGYTGQAWLPEIGLWYYRARMYNPSLPRFMQPDPIGYGAGMNLYVYVGNDPVNLGDPSGLSASEMWTGTRIPYANPEIGFGICMSCSGFSTAGPTGQGPGRDGGERGVGISLNLYRIIEKQMETGDATKTYEIRLGGSWEGAGQLGGGAIRIGQRLSPTLLALLADRDVNEHMGQAWANSMGDGPTGSKNEWGFWITQSGGNFIAHGLIQGIGPIIPRYNVHAGWVRGATIFFHVHPYRAGEARLVQSIGLSSGDMRIARDYRADVIAMARTPTTSQGFVYFEFDCRGGC